MQWLDRGTRGIMVVSGLLTCTMFYATIRPHAALQSNFGVTIPDTAIEIVVRNWGALIGLVGLALLYGAFNPGARRLALLMAAISKLTFITLVLTLGPQFLSHQAGVAVVADTLMVVLFLLLLRPRSA